MAKRITEEEYDLLISAHGKVVRVEAFKGMGTKILHTCLKHNETMLGLPETLARGHSLKCCQCKNIIHERAKEEYDRKLAVFGKAVRLGEYTRSSDKILHRCLIHGCEMLAKPASLLEGHGLYCCSNTVISNKKAAEEYDHKVAEIGRVERVDPYINRKTKIRHRCLEHNEIHKALPNNILLGKGLKCCSASNKSNAKARDLYDSKLESFGKVVRLGEYINNNTKILHRCLVHGQEHLAIPRALIYGGGLNCCMMCSHSQLIDLLNSKENEIKGTCVYLYKLANYPGYLKLGITSSMESRTKNKEFGEFISSWHNNSRLECHCVEQASLRDVLLRKSCPEPLQESKWGGHTEVIRCPEDTAIDVIQFYWDEMDRLGPYQFALDYLNPTSEETELLKEKLDHPEGVLE